MNGLRVAVFGLGRSGLAIARAARDRGGIVTVYDEQPKSGLAKREVYETARRDGLDVQLGWEGDFNADLVVANPAIPKTHPRLLRALEAGISVISEVEFAYRISKAPIVAITGTNGKSTTTVMTYLVLRACGVDAVLCGNIFGSGYPEMPLTDAAANSRPEQILVAEISSFQLEWVSQFQPIAAGITNIWPDHLDRYVNFEEYAETKQRIFRAQGPHDYAVVKANDPVVVPPGRRTATYRPRHRRGEGDGTAAVGPQVLTFGATGEHARLEESDLVILNRRIKLESLPFDEPHNYLNAAMAALLAYGALKNRATNDPAGHAARLLAAAEANRTDAKPKSVYSGRAPEPPPAALPEEIVHGLMQFRGIAHRMEHVGERNGVRIINNSMCTNPDAVIKSAMAVRDPAHLLIGGVNKSLDFAPLRHYLANQRHRAYLFGSDADALNEMLGGIHPRYRTLEEAFRAAMDAAVSGEVVMLAPGCASTDQFRDFRERGDVFRNIAKEWLSR